MNHILHRHLRRRRQPKQEKFEFREFHFFVVVVDKSFKERYREEKKVLNFLLNLICDHLVDHNSSATSCLTCQLKKIYVEEEKQVTNVVNTFCRNLWRCKLGTV